MPALYNLSGSRLLPDDFKIIGLDRTDTDDNGWRKSLTDTMQDFTKDKTAEFYTPKIDEKQWGRGDGQDVVPEGGFRSG